MAEVETAFLGRGAYVYHQLPLQASAVLFGAPPAISNVFLDLLLESKSLLSRGA